MKQHLHPALTACLIVLTITAGLLVASCQPAMIDEPSKLVASVRQADEWTRNFNPLSNRGDLLWPSRGGVYEPLLVYNVLTADYVPWLSVGYEWDETDQVVTFDLRPQVRWSDGEAFTAADVVFTFDILRRNPSLDHNNVWSYLREITPENDLRVSFVFDHTAVPALEHLAHQPIVPEHVWSSVEDPVAFLNPDPVATGPYTEVVHFEGAVYELGRNPHYWQAIENPVERLRVPVFADNTETGTAILAGKVDWSGNYIEDIENVFIAADPEHRFSWSPLIDGPVFLLGNTTKAPFNDVRVRKALSLAIDRERLVRETHPMSRAADGTCLDDGTERYRSVEATALDDWTTYDPARAENLLDQAGFPRGDNGLRGFTSGDPWDFEILVTGGWTNWFDMTEIISENLAAIGIQTRPGPLSFNDWQQRGQDGDFDLAFGMAESRLTAYSMFRSMMSSATVRPVGASSLMNWHRFSDEAADDLLLAYEMTSEADLQEEIIRRVQLRFVETAPAIPLVFGPSWGVVNSVRITGFPTADNPYARLSPNSEPDTLLVLTKLHPRE